MRACLCVGGVIDGLFFEDACAIGPMHKLVQSHMLRMHVLLQTYKGLYMSGVCLCDSHSCDQSTDKFPSLLQCQRCATPHSRQSFALLLTAPELTRLHPIMHQDQDIRKPFLDPSPLDFPMFFTYGTDNDHVHSWSEKVSVSPITP